MSKSLRHCARPPYSCVAQLGPWLKRWSRRTVNLLFTKPCNRSARKARGVKRREAPGLKDRGAPKKVEKGSKGQRGPHVLEHSRLEPKWLWVSLSLSLALPPSPGRKGPSGLQAHRLFLCGGRGVKSPSLSPSIRPSTLDLGYGPCPSTGQVIWSLDTTTLHSMKAASLFDKL